MSTLNNLYELIGEEWEVDEVIGAFEEDGEVIISDSSNHGYDSIAYINEVESSQYLFKIDKDNIITNVWISE